MGENILTNIVRLTIAARNKNQELQDHNSYKVVGYSCKAKKDSAWNAPYIYSRNEYVFMSKLPINCKGYF